MPVLATALQPRCSPSIVGQALDFIALCTRAQCQRLCSQDAQDNKMSAWASSYGFRTVQLIITSLH